MEVIDAFISSYKIARLLRDKGFDEPCEYCISPDDVVTGCDNMREPHKKMRNSEFKNRIDIVSCPTHQLVLSWLRSMGIEFWPSFRNGVYSITATNNNTILIGGKGATYEEATEDIIIGTLHYVDRKSENRR